MSSPYLSGQRVKCTSITTGADYEPLDVAGVFSPGNATTLCMELLITEDVIVEGDEGLSLSLSSADLAVVPVDTQLLNITIVDNDGKEGVRVIHLQQSK